MKDFNLIHELRLQGVDWQTIKDSVDWFTDNDRKLYAGYLIGKEEGDDTDVIKNAKTLQTIRLERKRLGIERSINNEQIRDITLHKTFTEQVVEGIKQLKNKICDDTIVNYIDDLETADIFVISDLHHRGYKNTLEQLNVARERIINEITQNKLEHIYLVELGDVVEGATLRPSQLFTVKSGLVNQTIEVAQAYVDLISTLTNHCDVTFITVDSSNHTQIRNLGTKQNQLIEEDLMQVFNQFISISLPKLKMIRGKDVLTDILGFKMFFAHGHLVKSKEKYIENLQADRNVLIDYGFFGHFHHMRDIDLHSGGRYDKKVFYVPSLSPDETDYEIDKNLSSVSGIAYYQFNRTDGHVMSKKLLIK